MLIRFGFNEKWKAWMRVCVFVGNFAVLVNGYPTQEISIQLDLKQEDPLSHFLFLFVVEGLSGLAYRVRKILVFTQG